MNEIANGKDARTGRGLNEQKETRELASHLVGLHMDTERSEAVLGGFKEHLLVRRPFHAEAIIEGIDREVRGRDAKRKRHQGKSGTVAARGRHSGISIPSGRATHGYGKKRGRS